MEITRAIRLQVTLPLHLWDDYVLTATYIINRLPSSVLSVWLFMVAYNPSRIQDKFQPRGAPCIFLGYVQTQKGYKLLNFITHDTFVTRDVVFFEHIFPYQKSSDAQCLQPLPAVTPQRPMRPNDLINFT